MLSRHAIGVAQRGQREAGRSTDSSWGRRWMQTLRKLPMQAPSAKAMLSTSQAPSSARMGSGDMLDGTAGSVNLAAATGQTRGGTKRCGGRPAARHARVRGWETSFPCPAPSGWTRHPSMTAPSLKMGRYMEMTRPPITTPRKRITAGSRRDIRLFTMLSTSSS